MRRHWRSLLLGHCTTVELRIPTPKSRSMKVTHTSPLYPAHIEALNNLSNLRLAPQRSVLQTTKECRKLTQFFKAELSFYGCKALSCKGTILRSYLSWVESSILISSPLCHWITNPLVCLFTWVWRATGSESSFYNACQLCLISTRITSFFCFLLSPIHIKLWLWRSSIWVMTKSLWWHA